MTVFSRKKRLDLPTCPEQILILLGVFYDPFLFELQRPIMMQKHFYVILLGSILVLAPFGSWGVITPPASVKVETGDVEPFCNSGVPPEWRDSQIVEGVKIQEQRVCNPDNPADIAAFVKGTNNISMQTLMDTNLAADALTLSNDMDGDGDPDLYVIKLEIMELNGHSPDFLGVVPTYDIAPGVQPSFWVYTPKTRDMSTKSFASAEANSMLRMPSPAIRVEQGDVVWLVLENTHYFPHSIHLHGVDHPYLDHSGEGNDGVGQTAQMDVMPGQTKTYVIKPRQTGTMYYHCHVQPHTHIPMGLAGLFIVEENRPNNWPQVFNVGNGKVRAPSVAVKEKYSQEYDMFFQSADRELHMLPQSANDPRLIAKAMNQEYDITDATDDYYMLNGRSFPYTLRESLIVVDPNEKIKLRVLNGHTEGLSLHIHGHKATETHYDGIEQNLSAQITRDVYSLSPAQRVDLELSTTDDGLHSYGSGLWMFHDHVEKAFTTNGMGEGGSISLVAYKEFLDDKGTPKVHGMDLSPYFSKKYWERKIPVWQNWADDWGGLGQPAVGAYATGDATPAMVPQAQPNSQASVSRWGIGNIFVGVFLGILGYLMYSKRARLIGIAGLLTGQLKDKK